MVSMRFLVSSQRRSVEELACQKDLSCSRCGSANPEAENEARLVLGGYAFAYLECANQECWQSERRRLKLSFEEAKEIGIDMSPREIPETRG